MDSLSLFVLSVASNGHAAAGRGGGQRRDNKDKGSREHCARVLAALLLAGATLESTKGKRSPVTVSQRDKASGLREEKPPAEELQERADAGAGGGGEA